MQYRLQLPDDTIADTNEDDVAIVDSTLYKGMNKCMISIKRQRSTDGPQLSKLVETAIHTTLSTWFFIVNFESSITPRSRTVSSGNTSTPPTFNGILFIFASICGEPSQINCVLSAFNLSQLDDIHLSTFSMQCRSWTADMDSSVDKQPA